MHAIDREERRTARRGHVLHDHHPLARLHRPLHILLRTVILRLLADHESLERQPLDTRHRDHGAGDRVGANRHSAHRRRQGTERPQAFEDRPPHEHRTVGVENHLLGVEIKARLAARGKPEGAAFQGLGLDQADEFAGDGRDGGWLLGSVHTASLYNSRQTF